MMEILQQRGWKVQKATAVRAFPPSLLKRYAALPTQIIAAICSTDCYGVTGSLANESLRVTFRAEAQLTDSESDDVIELIDLMDGDGMCMGYHGWIVNDFGALPPFVPE